MKIINKGFLVNEEIKAKEVRTIASDGKQLGILQVDEAFRLAEESELDLVMVSPNAKPPVCKIMNYGKFIYEQSKREKKFRKKQKVIVVKEIRLSPSIEEHDISVKANNARKFLQSGYKVKVSVRSRGREADYSFTGRKILNNFYSKLEDICSIEKKAKLEGRNMVMILSPNKS
ncbi:translation initiation factor IF-3 [Clostridium sp.]|uniref:translation initiation factor IF-3 n=1 Tax=Clostridium sp. TaxID=1506 RepID=UPI003A5C5738